MFRRASAPLATWQIPFGEAGIVAGWLEPLPLTEVVLKGWRTSLRKKLKGDLKLDLINHQPIGKIFSVAADVVAAESCLHPGQYDQGWI